MSAAAPGSGASSSSSSSSSDSVQLPMDPDQLFRAVHGFNQNPAASPSAFLSAVGGLPTLFTVAALLEDDITLRMLLAAISKTLQGASEQQARELLPYIVAGLTTGAKMELRLFVLNELRRHVKEWQRLMTEPPLLPTLLLLIAGKVDRRADDDEQAEAEEDAARQLIAPATSLVQALIAVSASNRELFFSSAVMSPLFSFAGLSSLSSLPAAAALDKTVLLRVFSFYVDMACSDVDCNALFISSPVPSLLLSALSALASDPLSQLNVVELLVQLTRDSPSLPSALCTSILSSLLTVSSSSSGTLSSSPLLATATLRVTEAMALGGKGEGGLWREPRLQGLLTSALETGDEVVVVQGVGALCAVAAMSLESFVMLAPICLRLLPWLVPSSSELLQLAALHGLKLLFAASPPPSSSASPSPAATSQAVLSLQEELFLSLGPSSSPASTRSTIALFQSILSTPFQPQRLAVLSLLATVAALPSRALLSALVTPGWVEWLLDRKTESELEGMRGKWELLRELARNPLSDDVVEAGLLRMVRLYVAQGPVYVAREAAVMTPLTKGDD